MENSTETLTFFGEKSKRGFPCLWESGGSGRNTGEAQIIAAADGSAKIPLYINRRGHLSNGQHALFAIKNGDLIITSDHHRGDHQVMISRISLIEEIPDGVKVSAIREWEYSQGEWEKEDCPPGVQRAVGAAMQKASCYHCRGPHWFSDGDER